MRIPPASPNRIMCRHSRAWCRLCRRSAVCCGSATLIWLLADCSASAEVPGGFAAGCIMQGYTTLRRDSPEMSSLPTERDALRLRGDKTMPGLLVCEVALIGLPGYVKS